MQDYKAVFPAFGTNIAPDLLPFEVNFLINIQF